MGHSAPINAMVSVTDRCTARCGYCGIPERGLVEPGTQALLRLIDELADAGTARIGFWGGEPLLREDLPVLLRRCKDRGIWTSIDTNGHLFARRVHELGDVGHVVFSLDGRRDAHDAARGAASWDRVMDGLDAARRHHIPYWTLTVLTGGALPDVPWLVELAEDRGHEAAFQVLHHPEELDGGKGASLAPDDEALRGTLSTLLRWRRIGRPIVNSARQLRHLLAWEDLSVPFRTDGEPCLAGKLYCNVDTDGRVLPCSLVGREGALSAYDVGFAAAFRAVAEPACRSCTATAFFEYDALLRLDPSAVGWWLRRLGR